MTEKRTKKDVRKFGKKGEYVNDDSDFGSVEFDESTSDDRRSRFETHGWIKSDDNPAELTTTGHAILFRWGMLVEPRSTLESEGVPTFVGKAESEVDPTWVEIPKEAFRGMEIKGHSGERVPSGISYHEREVRAGKTDVDMVCRAMSRDNHVIAKGETGVGKSYMADFVAQEVGLPSTQVNFSNEIRVQHLLGHHEVEEGDKGGTNMNFVLGVLSQVALAHKPECSHRGNPMEGECPECGQKGGVFIADEINAAGGKTTMMLHSLTEKDNPTLTIPELGETFQVHPDFHMIGTMNPRYAGTKKQNKAFKTRFFHIEMDYLPEDVETEIVMENTDLTARRESEVKKVVELAADLRDDYKRGELSSPVTPRELIRIGEFMEGGWMSPEEATKSVLLGKMPPEDESAVDKKIETKL
jgi:nitric oxide reductase NorQ protein/cobaltochelatase CobS